MTLAGSLIVESLLVGTVLEAATLTVRKISRADIGDVPESQLDWPE